MNLLKGIRYNEEFAKNVPDDILDKLIHYDGVIPDEISYIFRMNHPKFDEERSDFLDNHEEIIKQMYRVRWEEDQIYEKEGLTQSLSVESDREMSFIRDNPELIPMVDCIELLNADSGNHELVETISFEEYVDMFLD